MGGGGGYGVSSLRVGVVTSKPQTLPVIVSRTPCSQHGFASVFFKVECLAHVVTPSVIAAALYDSAVKGKSFGNDCSGHQR